MKSLKQNIFLAMNLVVSIFFLFSFFAGFGTFFSVPETILYAITFSLAVLNTIGILFVYARRINNLYIPSTLLFIFSGLPSLVFIYNLGFGNIPRIFLWIPIIMLFLIPIISLYYLFKR